MDVHSIPNTPGWQASLSAAPYRESSEGNRAIPGRAFEAFISNRGLRPTASGKGCLACITSAAHHRDCARRSFSGNVLIQVNGDGITATWIDFLCIGHHSHRRATCRMSGRRQLNIILNFITAHSRELLTVSRPVSRVVPV